MRARAPISRAAAFAYVALAYAIAGAVAWLFVTRGVVAPAWAAILAADVAATVVVFAFSVVFDNSSFYDPHWSVAPMVIAPWLFASSSDAPFARRAVVLVLVLAWGARLTWNWARGWEGLAHEDWRYVDLRAKHARAYWLISLIGIHMMPTIWVYLGCLALLPAMVSGTRPLGPIDAVAFAVTAGAIAIEAIADEQLRAFRRDAVGRGRIMDRGLWSWSRHPNYFGELSFWWGLWLFGLAADPTAYVTIAGPVSITLLFVFVSVPMLDRRSLARRPAYVDHMKRVSGLFPRPPRRDHSERT
jgi:steroid 5-alpha reductase family enzyme